MNNSKCALTGCEKPLNAKKRELISEGFFNGHFCSDEHCEIAVKGIEDERKQNLARLANKRNAQVLGDFFGNLKK